MQMLSKRQNRTMLANLASYIKFHIECYGENTIPDILGISKATWREWNKAAAAGIKMYKMSSLTKVCDATSIPLEKLLDRTVTFDAALAAMKDSRQRSAMTLLRTPHGVVVNKHKIHNYHQGK